MYNLGQIEAVRLVVNRRIENESSLSEGPVTVPDSPDPWKIAILRESDDLYEYTAELTQTAFDLYAEDLWARVETDGRLVEIAFPVQLSRGIVKMSQLIGDAERRLEKFDLKLRNCCEHVEFLDGSPFDEQSRIALKLSQEMIERQRLHLHTYLWVLWTQESLEQANQFGGVVKNPDFRPEQREDSFQYIAHSPLVVATLSITAMIEEIGATYINKHTEDSVDFNNTSCSKVLKDLERHYPKIDEYDVNSIRRYVVDSRNDYAHYITRRGDAITLENFEEYYSAIREGLSLVKEIADQLIMESIAKYEKSQELVNRPTENRAESC